MLRTLLCLVFFLSLVQSCERNGDVLRCMHRWNGGEVKITQITVYQWDGTCAFPAGAALSLYGDGVDCRRCPFSIAASVSVNGRACSDVAERSTGVNTAREKYTTRTTTVTTTVHTEMTTISRVAGSVASWHLTNGLLGTLGLAVLLLTVLLVLTCVRFRQRRAYLCCKPRTSPDVSMESVVI